MYHLIRAENYQYEAFGGPFCACNCPESLVEKEETRRKKGTRYCKYEYKYDIHTSSLSYLSTGNDCVHYAVWWLSEVRQTTVSNASEDSKINHLDFTYVGSFRKEVHYMKV